MRKSRRYFAAGPWSDPLFGAERPLRICIAAHGFQVGGGELSPILIANALRGRGHSIVYLVVDDAQAQPGLRSRLDPVIPVVRWQDVAGDIAGFLDRAGVQVLNSHNLSFDHRLFHARPRRLPPFVVSLRGSYEASPDYLSADFMRFMEGAASRWLYLADKNLRPLRQAGVDPATFRRSFNACEPPQRPRAARAEVRARFGLPEEAFVLALASRAIAEKGWDIAAEVARDLQALRPGGVMAVLMGDGPGLRDFRAAYGASPFVRICGHVDAPSRFLGAFDLGILPSTFAGESFPRFLLECFQAGVPALSTDIGAAAELFGPDPDEAPGALVPHEASQPAITRMMTDHARRALTEPGLHAAWAARAAQAAARFDVARLVEHYEQVFAEII